MREVILYGPMRAKFGRSFMLDVNSPAEAINALSSVVPGFRAWFGQQAQKGAVYHVLVGKKDIGEDELTYPAIKGEPIRIAPTIAGAKRGGILQTIVGVVLLVVSYIFPPAAPYLAPSAIGMILGGVIQMLAPQNKNNGAEQTENTPSYIFNGAVNTQAQGHPVPLLFGRMVVGSAVISAGITTEQIAIAN